MRNRHACFALLACLMAFLFSASARAQVHPHHAAQIRKAAQEVKCRVAPKKPRTVLIWNTPPHLMDKDPHKGYCIPYGEEGMRAIGEASGAFRPVVSDDIAMFAPERIRQFDAIVLNNASGPWITPTDADLAKPALKKLGSDTQQVETVLRESFLDFLDQGGGVVSLHFAEDQRRDHVRVGRPRSQTPRSRLARPAGPRRPADARTVQGHLLAEAVER